MTKKDLYHYRKCYGTYKAIAPFEIIERNSYREALKLLFHFAQRAYHMPAFTQKIKTQ